MISCAAQKTSICSMGLFWRSIRVGCVDEGEEKLHCDDSSVMHKSLSIEGLNIYCDSSKNRTVTPLAEKMPFISYALPSLQLPNPLTNTYSDRFISYVLSDFNLSSEFTCDLRRAEDRWPHPSELVAAVSPLVPDKDRGCLASFLNNASCPLYWYSRQYSSEEELCRFLTDSLHDSTLDATTMLSVSQVLFPLLKTPKPRFALVASVGEVNVALDNQHLLFVSDLMSSLPSPSPSDPPIESTNASNISLEPTNASNTSLEPEPSVPEAATASSKPRFTARSLALYLTYSLFSSYSLFFIALFTVLFFPFCLFYSVAQAVGSVLLVGSGLLFFNRYMVDSTDALPDRRDDERTQRISVVELEVDTQPIRLVLTHSIASDQAMPLVSSSASFMQITLSSLHVGVTTHPHDTSLTVGVPQFSVLDDQTLHTQGTASSLLALTNLNCSLLTVASSSSYHPPRTLQEVSDANPCKAWTTLRADVDDLDCEDSHPE